MLTICRHVLVLHTSSCVEVAKRRGREGRGGARRKEKQRTRRSEEKVEEEKKTKMTMKMVSYC